MVSRKRIGEIGEVAARRYLETIGYRIVDTNFRTRVGEIDLIAYDDAVLAFIEVKTRRNTRCGSPGEAVDWKKRKKINKVALVYMSKNRLFDRQVRFDVVEIIIENNHIKLISLIKDAFQTVG